MAERIQSDYTIIWHKDWLLNKFIYMPTNIYYKSYVISVNVLH